MKGEIDRAYDKGIAETVVAFCLKIPLLAVLLCFAIEDVKGEREYAPQVVNHQMVNPP